MRLTPPKQSTYWISVVLVVLGLLGKFMIAALAPFAFWLVAVGYLILFLGLVLKGF